jgi:hypothetical protein
MARTYGFGGSTPGVIIHTIPEAPPLSDASGGPATSGEPFSETGSSTGGLEIGGTVLHGAAALAFGGPTFDAPGGAVLHGASSDPFAHVGGAELPDGSLWGSAGTAVPSSTAWEIPTAILGSGVSGYSSEGFAEDDTTVMSAGDSSALADTLDSIPLFPTISTNLIRDPLEDYGVFSSVPSIIGSFDFKPIRVDDYEATATGTINDPNWEDTNSFIQMQFMIGVTCRNYVALVMDQIAFYAYTNGFPGKPADHWPYYTQPPMSTPRDSSMNHAEEIGRFYPNTHHGRSGTGYQYGRTIRSQLQDIADTLAFGPEGTYNHHLWAEGIPTAVTPAVMSPLQIERMIQNTHIQVDMAIELARAQKSWQYWKSCVRSAIQNGANKAGSLLGHAVKSVITSTAPGSLDTILKVMSSQHWLSAINYTQYASNYLDSDDIDSLAHSFGISEFTDLTLPETMITNGIFINAGSSTSSMRMIFEQYLLYDQKTYEVSTETKLFSQLVKDLQQALKVGSPKWDYEADGRDEIAGRRYLDGVTETGNRLEAEQSYDGALTKTLIAMKAINIQSPTGADVFPDSGAWGQFESSIPSDPTQCISMITHLMMRDYVGHVIKKTRGFCTIANSMTGNNSMLNIFNFGGTIYGSSQRDGPAITQTTARTPIFNFFLGGGYGVTFGETAPATSLHSAVAAKLSDQGPSARAALIAGGTDVDSRSVILPLELSVSAENGTLSYIPGYEYFTEEVINGAAKLEYGQPGTETAASQLKENNLFVRQRYGYSPGESMFGGVATEELMDSLGDMGSATGMLLDTPDYQMNAFLSMEGMSRLKTLAPGFTSASSNMVFLGGGGNGAGILGSAPEWRFLLGGNLCAYMATGNLMYVPNQMDAMFGTTQAGNSYDWSQMFPTNPMLFSMILSSIQQHYTNYLGAKIAPVPIHAGFNFHDMFAPGTATGVVESSIIMQMTITLIVAQSGDSELMRLFTQYIEEYYKNHVAGNFNGTVPTGSSATAPDGTAETVIISANTDWIRNLELLSAKSVDFIYAAEVFAAALLDYINTENVPDGVVGLYTGHSGAGAGPGLTRWTLKSVIEETSLDFFAMGKDESDIMEINTGLESLMFNNILLTPIGTALMMDFQTSFFYHAFINPLNRVRDNVTQLLGPIGEEGDPSSKWPGWDPLSLDIAMISYMHDTTTGEPLPDWADDLGFTTGGETLEGRADSLEEIGLSYDGSLITDAINLLSPTSTSVEVEETLPAGASEEEIVTATAGGTKRTSAGISMPESDIHGFTVLTYLRSMVYGVSKYLDHILGEYEFSMSSSHASDSFMASSEAGGEATSDPDALDEIVITLQFDPAAIHAMAESMYRATEDSLGGEASPPLSTLSSTMDLAQVDAIHDILTDITIPWSILYEEELTVAGIMQALRSWTRMLSSHAILAWTGRTSNPEVASESYMLPMDFSNYLNYGALVGATHEMGVMTSTESVKTVQNMAYEYLTFRVANFNAANTSTAAIETTLPDPRFFGNNYVGDGSAFLVDNLSGGLPTSYATWNYLPTPIGQLNNIYTYTLLRKFLEDGWLSGLVPVGSEQVDFGADLINQSEDTTKKIISVGLPVGLVDKLRFDKLPHSRSEYRPDEDTIKYNQSMLRISIYKYDLARYDVYYPDPVSFIVDASLFMDTTFGGLVKEHRGSSGMPMSGDLNLSDFTSACRNVGAMRAINYMSDGNTMKPGKPESYRADTSIFGIEAPQQTHLWGSWDRSTSEGGIQRNTASVGYRGNFSYCGTHEGHAPCPTSLPFDAALCLIGYITGGQIGVPGGTYDTVHIPNAYKGMDGITDWIGMVPMIYYGNKCDPAWNPGLAEGDEPMYYDATPSSHIMDNFYCQVDLSGASTGGVPDMKFASTKYSNTTGQYPMRSFSESHRLQAGVNCIKDRMLKEYIMYTLGVDVRESAFPVFEFAESLDFGLSTGLPSGGTEPPYPRRTLGFSPTWANIGFAGTGAVAYATTIPTDLAMREMGLPLFKDFLLYENAAGLGSGATDLDGQSRYMGLWGGYDPQGEGIPPWASTWTDGTNWVDDMGSPHLYTINGMEQLHSEYRQSLYDNCLSVYYDAAPMAAGDTTNGYLKTAIAETFHANPAAYRNKIVAPKYFERTFCFLVDCDEDWIPHKIETDDAGIITGYTPLVDAGGTGDIVYKSVLYGFYVTVELIEPTY